MPQQVLDSAEDTLKALEAKDASFGEIRKARTIPAGTVESDGSIQLSLFQLDDPTLSSLRDTLRAADLNNMTPLQAFDLLRSMKKELNIT